MKSDYSIDEILKAFKLIENKQEKNNFDESKNIFRNNKSNIPQNTLKLIEEAEKSKI